MTFGKIVRRLCHRRSGVRAGAQIRFLLDATSARPPRTLARAPPAPLRPELSWLYMQRLRMARHDQTAVSLFSAKKMTGGGRAKVRLALSGTKIASWFNLAIVLVATVKVALLRPSDRSAKTSRA